MKKRVALILSLAMLFSLTACDKNVNKPSSSQNSKVNTESVSEQQNVKLTNHMTEKEKSSISVGNFSLGDLSPIGTEETTVPSVDKHTVLIDLWDGNDYLEWIQDDEVRSMFTEDEYNKSIDSYKEMIANGQKGIHGIVIDGRPYYGFMPVIDYDGGYITYYMCVTDFSDESEDSEVVTEQKQIEFDSFEKFKPWYREYLDQEVSDGLMTQKEADQDHEDMLVIFDSVMNRTYEIADKHIDSADFHSGEAENKDWEFNQDEVQEIIDSIKEISVYDEELDTTFIVHVTLPPEFNKSKTYPMFVMTDGVWRFGDHPALRKMMENGEAEDVILVSIGYDFSIDGTDNSVRGHYFCDEKENFLNFITDNLMPYLNEEYSIDFGSSTLYGHSLGGVFTHYAVFNSDNYENQPFYNYIIGSPAFWSPCFPNKGDYKSEYGYFDRNEKLDKFLYVSGGENEDPDYEEYYGEGDSTLEGISHLMERLEKYGVTSAECKIYEDSNHYEYIPNMFRTFFIEYYKG